MAAPNASDLFCKAVSEGSLDELNVLYGYHGREAIVANFMDTCINKQGDTCLKVAVESKFYDVIEFLINQLKEHIMCCTWKTSIENVSPFSWESCTFKEVSEPFVLSPDIAIIRDICHQMPITKLIEYLVDVTNDEPLWLEFVLSSIMASSIPRPDRIVALECMGIAFIFKQTRNLFENENYYVVPKQVKFWRGLRCWKEALILRNATADGDPAIPKIPCEQPEMLRNALGDIAEITTVEELEQLEQHLTLPKVEDWEIFKSGKMLRQSLEAQALLVGHRIFTQQNSTGLNSFHLENLVLFCNNIRQPSFEYQSYTYSVRMFNICLVILDQSYWFTSTSPHKCIGHFDKTLNLLLKSVDSDQKMREITSTNIVLTTKYTLAVLANVFSVSRIFHLKSYIAQTQIYFLLSERLSRLTQEQIANIKGCLIPFFRIYNSNQLIQINGGLLHLAVVECCRGRRTSSTKVQLIQLMLEAGADPQITDGDGRTPFHCLFQGSVWRYARWKFKAVFKAILDAGGHLDQATSSGHTVISLIKDLRTCTSFFANIVRDPYFDSFIYSVLPLSCTCAQVLRQNQIPFENQLPPSLKSFVLRHSAIKITRMKKYSTGSSLKSVS